METLLADTDLLDELVAVTTESIQLLQRHSRRVEDVEVDTFDAAIRAQESLHFLAHVVDAVT